MAAATAYSVHDKLRSGRFSGQEWSNLTTRRKASKPDDEESPKHRCPYCEQLLPHSGTTIFSMFRGGVRRLRVAVTMLAVATLRCVRFTAAVSFCFIGLVGDGLRALGLRIAHPEDQQLIATLFLPRSDR